MGQAPQTGCSSRTHTVLDALRRFLPSFLESAPALSPQQRRAIWAITHCRTPELGGRLFDCQPCGRVHLAFHSCNHKACPQCGKGATAQWIQRELNKRLNAPYYLVTFTLPSQLRSCFFGPHAKEAYDLFFAAVSSALSEKLADDKNLRAQVNGFTAVLHTWNQQLGFHPHIHCLVPGAGLNERGRLTRVRKPKFLVYQPRLQSAFRQHLGRLLAEHGWQVDPDAWTQKWGVDIKPVGAGAAAVKYLGAYVARTAISDRRVINVDERQITFWWKDRDRGNRREVVSLTGHEFVRRYLRHVLPRGLRSVRYYGFCHPTAKRNRLRVQLLTGMAVSLGAQPTSTSSTSSEVRCPSCRRPMRLVLWVRRHGKTRAPPGASFKVHPASHAA